MTEPPKDLPNILEVTHPTYNWESLLAPNNTAYLEGELITLTDTEKHLLEVHPAIVPLENGRFALGCTTDSIQLAPDSLGETIVLTGNALIYKETLSFPTLDEAQQAAISWAGALEKTRDQSLIYWPYLPKKPDGTLATTGWFVPNQEQMQYLQDHGESSMTVVSLYGETDHPNTTFQR